VLAKEKQEVKKAHVEKKERVDEKQRDKDYRRRTNYLKATLAKRERLKTEQYQVKITRAKENDKRGSRPVECVWSKACPEAAIRSEATAT
jgi:hypothetical protein